MKIIIILYGIIIGSFLNVCIYRIPKKENISQPSSHCMNCYKKIKWYDKIPIISYINLNGKCRNCNQEISRLYPVVEILNAIIYITLYKKYDFSIEFLFFSAIMSVLLIIFFIDFKHMIIPDILVIILFILEILHKITLFFLNKEIFLKMSIVGAVLAIILFLFIIIVSGGGMGSGDVTLISSLGFILGLRLILINILLSFILGAIISIILLLNGIKTRKDPIPFGPFIIISFFIVLLFGDTIIDLYMNYILIYNLTP